MNQQKDLQTKDSKALESHHKVIRLLIVAEKDRFAKHCHSTGDNRLCNEVCQNAVTSAAGGDGLRQ